MAVSNVTVLSQDVSGKIRSKKWSTALPRLYVFPLILMAVAVYVPYRLLGHKLPPPKVDLERWWGKGGPTEKDTGIRPFKMHFDDEMIKDLRFRLKNRRDLTPPLEGVAAEYGINTDYLNRILNYWMEKYDFKLREDSMNTYPRFKTKIQGLDISFVHAKPKLDKGSELKIVPLLMLHGWPSSGREFLSVVPHLVTPMPGRDYVFEVICPDLPGYGFSEPTNKPGLNPMEMSVIMRNLMDRIGLPKYFVHGTDWGAEVSSALATLFPDKVAGLHLSLAHADFPISRLKILLGSLYPKWAAGEHADRIYPLSKSLGLLIRESGYFHIQATKPDTVGVGLMDSPSGMAGYILEKVGAITEKNALHRPDGGIGNAYKMDDLLDMLTIVWANRCITTSMRTYAEAAGPMRAANSRDLSRVQTLVPTAVINFKNEVLYVPDWILRDKYVNLVHSTVVPRGGHFASMEVPQLLAEDLWKAVDKFKRILSFPAPLD